MDKIRKIIKSIILCLKFPFLYPRNRFTGNHYDNWKLRKFHTDNYSKARYAVFAKIGNCEGNGHYHFFNPEKTSYVRSEFKDDEIIFIYGINSKEQVLKRVRLGSKINGLSWNGGSLKIEVESKENLKPEFRDRNLIIVDLVLDKFLWWKIRFLDWINDYLLQLFHCIPGYTELDCLDRGWKKKFGLDLCKDLKKALLHDGGRKALMKFRITQMKEKWGQFELYCNWYTPEVDKVIHKYQEISRTTCVSCGKPAKWLSSGWISPYCDDCIGNDLGKVEIKEE